MIKVKVTPISNKAKNRLANQLKGNDILFVEKETTLGNILLVSPDKEYWCWESKCDPVNWTWEVIDE